MSEEAIEQIRIAVEAALTRRINKLSYAVWSMVVGGVGALVFLGVQWGKIRNDVDTVKIDVEKHEANRDLHMPTDVKFQTFISRTEYLAIKNEREKALDKSILELKEAIVRLNEKIDQKL